jgi:chromosome segregation ATPase
MAVVYAARCGAKLSEVKSGLKHGEWLPWLQENCQVGERQARRYITLSQNYPELLETNRTLGSDLPGIQQALALITADDETKAIVQEKLDAGQSVSVKEIELLKREAEEAKAKLADAQGIANGKQGIIDILERKLSEKPNEVVIEREVIPEDYESLKRLSAELEIKSASLESDIEAIKAKLAQEVDRGVRSYLSERQKELDDAERKLERLREESEKCRAEIVGANRKEQELKAQSQAIDDANFALNKLAVALSSFEFSPDGHVERQWQALQISLVNGSEAIKAFTAMRLTGGN